ncbi:MAG: hypothetical protein M1827_006623 [Pycnora praestabilis]|nr:MAG: hypothetical protein M1827_006623 [Pycnora praestabilis]
MVLELHVWGPAFSLPSIDVQCLATIAYFTQSVPKGEWALIASSDPSPSPTKDLPALRNGSTWVGGFRNIIDYIRQYSDGQWDLDSELEQHEKADCSAFSSFLETNGQLLLDLSLYGSTQNYTSVTRSAYSSILPWPTQYFIPPKRREAAKARTTHLGLSAVDFDNAGNTKVGESSTNSQIPESLRTRPKQTLSSLLGQAQHTNHFRLNPLMTSFLEPLQDLLEKKRFLLSESKPSSLDCQAVAYLALSLYPDLPQSWLAETMRTKFGRLCAYVHDLRQTFYGGAVNVEDALPSSRNINSQDSAQQERDQRARGKLMLPWLVPESEGLLGIGSLLVENIADSIPIISQFRTASRLRDAHLADALTDEDKSQVKASDKALRRELLTQIATVTVGVSAFVGYLFYTGIVSISSGEAEADNQEEGIERANLGDMGEAGAALAALANQMDHDVVVFENEKERNRPGAEPVVEVGVKVDEQPTL